MMDAHWRSAVHPDRVEGIGAFNDGREPTFDDSDFWRSSASTRPKEAEPMTALTTSRRPRASLVMINPAPYNAEAPPEALLGEITPTELHYVRSNFAVPDHDGTWRSAERSAPDDADLDDLRAMPIHDQRHPRVRRQRSPGDEAVADRGTLGRLRRLHRAMDRCSPARGPGEGRAGRAGSRSSPKGRTTARTTSRRSCPRPTRTT